MFLAVEDWVGQGMVEGKYWWIRCGERRGREGEVRRSQVWGEGE